MVIPNPDPKVTLFSEVDSAQTDLWAHHSRTSRCDVARRGEKPYRTARWSPRLDGGAHAAVRVLLGYTPDDQPHLAADLSPHQAADGAI